jgi:hypothetical protein
MIFFLAERSGVPVSGLVKPESAASAIPDFHDGARALVECLGDPLHALCNRIDDFLALFHAIEAAVDVTRLTA